MRIEPCEKYITALAGLWNKVFGDSYSYINLFFEKEFFLCDTFAEFDNDRIVSVLYLLNGNISFQGEKYKGKYLYAAATDPEYRGKGYMSELIKQAQSFCENQGVDFICLVPANEGLYGYYSKFGFVCAMYRYKTVISDFSKKIDSDFSVKDSSYEESIHKIRPFFKDNFFCFEKDDSEYAARCINASDGIIHLTSDKGYFISDCEAATVEEFLTAKDNYEPDLKKLLFGLECETTVFSPYDLSEYGKTTINKFGMIYPINEKLKRDWDLSDIYMNLALD